MRQYISIWIQGDLVSPWIQGITVQEKEEAVISDWQVHKFTQYIRDHFSSSPKI